MRRIRIWASSVHDKLYNLRRRSPKDVQQEGSTPHPYQGAKQNKTKQRPPHPLGQRQTGKLLSQLKGKNMEAQRYYNIIERKEVIIDDSNYNAIFATPNAREYYMIMRGDEQVLLDLPDNKYPEMRTIMTTKAVMVWIPTSDDGMLSIYRFSTNQESHYELLIKLPDELHTLSQHYENDFVTEDTIQKAKLLSHIKKAKPTKRLKGKYKDVHN